VFFYAGLLLHYNTEAGAIKNLFVNTLSERYEDEKAEQDEVSARP
jgi:hypothetical protein